MLKDKYRIKEMNFPDKRAALEWIYRKQLGSRNLTNMQRTYIIGKIYEARKNTNSFKGNQFHNQSSHKQSLNTADLIGKEIGIAGRSVRRAEKYSKGIDALRGASVDAANKVLNGQSNLTKENVGELSKMEPKEVEDIALAIVSDEPLPQQRADQGHTSLDNQENVEELDAFIADLCDYSPVPDYKVDCIFYENQFCTREYVQQARQVLKGYREVFVSENNHDISDVITRYLSKMLRKLKGILK